MATIVQGTCDSATNSTAVASFQCGFAGEPAIGNVLVCVFGARDEGNNASPAFTVTAGWDVVGVATPMEFHTVGIAWRIADGSATDDLIVITPTTGNVQFWWCGVLEFNQAGVTTWEVDASSFNGSGATSVSSIASGSTGTLSSAVGVAVIVGTSRTGSEDLSSDTGDTLTGVDVTFEADAVSANYIAEWLNLTATTALDATITEAAGSSRMGAGIAVFVEAGGVAPTDLVVADLTVASTIDAVALTQVHELVVADLTVQPTIDAPTLTQVHNLTVADITVTATIGTVALTQVHELAVGDLTVASSIDAVVLTVGGIDLEVADLTVAATIDAVALTQVHELAVADLTVTSSIDAVVLTQTHVLVVADLTVAVTIDAVVLTVGALDATTIIAPTYQERTHAAAHLEPTVAARHRERTHAPTYRES